LFVRRLAGHLHASDNVVPLDLSPASEPYCLAVHGSFFIHVARRDNATTRFLSVSKFAFSRTSAHRTGPCTAVAIFGAKVKALQVRVLLHDKNRALSVCMVEQKRLSNTNNRPV